MANSRHKTPARGAVKYKRSRILKRVKRKKIEVISRKAQPQWKIKVRVSRLEKKVSVEGEVASSWIAALKWDADKKIAIMYLLSGLWYSYKIPFAKFEGWYYAHSKGTYFNEVIRGTPYIGKGRY